MIIEILPLQYTEITIIICLTLSPLAPMFPNQADFDYRLPWWDVSSLYMKALRKATSQHDTILWVSS